MRTVTVACCHTFGDPRQVVQVETRELDDQRLGPTQVLVEMLAAPVNPADINIIQGTYGRRPPLPASLGNEGAGRVIAVGGAVRRLRLDQLVRPVPGVGAWQSALIADEKQLMALPDGLEPEQAATLCINPATAWRMLHDFVRLQPGDWVVQNAANSDVGRYVIQLAHYLDFHTVNVVRRPGLETELEAIGADRVVTEELDLGARVKELTGGAWPRLALNSVGGASALNLAKALGRRGALVTYGAMGRQPLAIPNGLLIFSELACCGFWVTAWYERAAPAKIEEMFAALGLLLRDGELVGKVARRYPLAEAPQAVAHAMQEQRQGKILLTISS